MAPKWMYLQYLQHLVTQKGLQSNQGWSSMIGVPFYIFDAAALEDLPFQPPTSCGDSISIVLTFIIIRKKINPEKYGRLWYPLLSLLSSHLHSKTLMVPSTLSCHFLGNPLRGSLSYRKAVYPEGRWKAFTVQLPLCIKRPTSMPSMWLSAVNFCLNHGGSLSLALAGMDPIFAISG